MFSTDGMRQPPLASRVDTSMAGAVTTFEIVPDHAMMRPYTKVQKALRKQDPRPVWLLETCPLDNVWVKIGDEDYVVNATNAKLMPAWKDHPPPDLSYFEQSRK